MGTTTADEITRLIHAVECSDPNASDTLFKAVYADLRAHAAARLRRMGPDQTLQATELVHEAYVRLLSRPVGEPSGSAIAADPDAPAPPPPGRVAVGGASEVVEPPQGGTAPRQLVYEGRRHYFFSAARAIHDIIVERLRRRVREREIRGAVARQRPTITIQGHEGEATRVLEVSAALDRLRMIRPEWADLVMLRYFAGLSCEQVAEMLDLSTATVSRRWRFAKAWLAAELGEAPSGCRVGGEEGSTRTSPARRRA